MIRTINHTGRIKLPASCANISLLKEDNNELRFSADIQFGERKLEKDARIYIEAYYKSSFMRFDFGTVGNIKEPVDNALTEIQDEIAFFRLKIVDKKQEKLGRLIAQADRIMPKTPVDAKITRSGLLPVMEAELGDQIWRLDIDNTVPMPILEINHLDNEFTISEYVRNHPMFRCLVFPWILEFILVFIYGNPPEDEEGGWKEKWLKFAERLPGSSPHPDLTNENSALFEEWTETCVKAFCEKYKTKEDFKGFLFEIEVRGEY